MSVRVEHGDSRDVLKTLADGSVDSCVSDPPYSLVSIQKRFGKPGSAPAQEGRDGLYRRASAGFMGKTWDTGETAFDPAFWAEVYRVLKPGAHLVAFSGTRTYHRMVCAIEDAGFEIRDQIGWAYGSGFPKSHNQSGDWEGWGTALKPAWEPICLARKPLIGTVAANLLEHGTGALNIGGCRVGTDGGTKGCDAGPSNGILGDGLNGSFGKPVPGLGRWPANVIHDGSEEVLAAFPDAPGQQRAVTGAEPSSPTKNVYGARGRRPSGFGNVGAGKGDSVPNGPIHNDSGSAARFFYSAKADAEDRFGSKHPTVKPIDLIAYLCRLVTPPGGTVLDPFAGSGTTGAACMREGFDCILIEREAEYIPDILARIELASADGRHPAAIKHRNVDPAKARGEDLPMFAGSLDGAA